MTTRTHRFRDRGAETILESAAAILAERGTKASMADVADAAGVGRSTLYRYFPSREALLAALAEAALTEAADRVREARLDAVTVDEGVARLARAFVAVGNRYIVLIREGASVDVDKEALERDCRAPVQALFARGQANGVLRDDIAIEWLEKLFIGSILAGLTLAGRLGAGAEETAANVVSLFLDGARSRDTEQRA